MNKKTDGTVVVRTLKDRINTAGETETSKLVVEDLVTLESCPGVVRDLNARRLSVKYTVMFEDRIAHVADQHTGLGVTKDVIVLQES